MHFGGREKYAKSKIFMVPVNKRDAKTLLPIITKSIAKGYIIHTFFWKAYHQLEKMGYQHVNVNLSKQFLNPETAVCTNSIESDWRHAKVSIPTYGVTRDSKQHIWQNSYGCKNIMMRITSLKLFKLLTNYTKKVYSLPLRSKRMCLKLLHF